MRESRNRTPTDPRPLLVLDGAVFYWTDGAPKGSLSELLIGIGKVAFSTTHRFYLAAAKQDLFRGNPGNNIVFGMGFAKKPAAYFLSTNA